MFMKHTHYCPICKKQYVRFTDRIGPWVIECEDCKRTKEADQDKSERKATKK
jgi:ribosomal protein L37AE/L43A